MATLARVSLDEVRTWKAALIGEWSAGDDGGLDGQQDQEEDLYFQRFEPEAPGGRMKVKTGSAPADADAAVDSLAPVSIQVKVKPARDKKKYRKQADLLVRFAQALLDQWRTPKDQLRLIAFDQVVRRVGVARVLLDETRWPEHPADWDALDEEAQESWSIRNRRKCPIVFQRRNPRYVRWRATDEGDLLVVVEHYQTTVLEARLEFGAYPASDRILRGREPQEAIWVDDCWVGAYRCILLDEEPVFPGRKGDKYQGVHEHGYPEIPYLLAPFRENGFETPAERYRGMLTNAAQLYPMESQALTMHMWMLAYNAWRTYYGWTKDNRDIEIEPGHFFQIDRRVGEYIEMLRGEPVPPELLQSAAMFDSYIQRNGVAGGPRTNEGSRSAQQVWAQQSLKSMKLEGAKGSLEALVGGALRLGAIILEEKLEESVVLPVPGHNREGEPYGEVRIGPDDIDGYTDAFQVSFGRRLDPAQLEQAKALSALAQNNWMPWRESVELSGLTDVAQEWYDELMDQATDRLPFIMELAALIRARSWLGEDTPEYQILLQKVSESQQGGQGQQGGGQQSGAPGVPSPGGMQVPGSLPRAAGQAVGQQMAATSQPHRGRGAGRGGPAAHRPPGTPAPQGGR